MGACDWPDLIVDTALEGSQAVFAPQHAFDMDAQHCADGKKRPTTLVTSRSQQIANFNRLTAQPRRIARVRTDGLRHVFEADPCAKDRKSTRLNSSHMSISYAVFCL